MKNLQEWIDFKANCMMVLQHISSMSFEVGEDKITIKYNGLSGEYKLEDLPIKQKELLQKSINDAFSAAYGITELMRQYVLDLLQTEAREYVGILDDLKSFVKDNK